MTEIKPGNYGVVSHQVGFIPAAIRLATRSEFSHAFVVVDGGMVVEAMPQGAILSPLTKYTDRPPHEIVWNDEEPLSDVQRAGIVQHARSLVGTPYGYVDIAALGLMSLGFHPNWLIARAQQERALICSQLTARAYYLGGGIDVAHGKPDATVTPAALVDRVAFRWWSDAAAA